MSAVVDPFGIGVDSYNRLRTVLANRQKMPALEWFAMLGDAWSACDNIAVHRAELRRILATAKRAKLDAMMTSAERDALAVPPGRLFVWRGCYAVNRAGLSWTLDRCVAQRIVALNRYRRAVRSNPAFWHGVARSGRVEA